MPGIFQVKDLETKKKALIAESEVYRQMLKLEARNVALYAQYAKGKLSRPAVPKGLLLLIPSLATFLLGRQKPKLPKLVSTALLGWQAYQRFAPLCRSLFAGRFRRREYEFESDEAAPEANI